MPFIFVSFRKPKLFPCLLLPFLLWLSSPACAAGVVLWTPGPTPLHDQHRLRLPAPGSTPLHELTLTLPSSLPLSAGARLPFEGLDGESEEAVVRQYTEFPNGDRSWNLSITRNGLDYPLSLTFGKGAVFGTYMAEEGEYRLVGFPGAEGYAAWLFPAGEAPQHSANSGSPAENHGQAHALASPVKSTFEREGYDFRLSLYTGATRYLAGQPIEYAVEIENVAPESRQVDALAIDFYDFNVHLPRSYDRFQNSYSITAHPSECTVSLFFGHSTADPRRERLVCAPGRLDAGETRTYTLEISGDTDEPISLNAQVTATTPAGIGPRASLGESALYPDLLKDSDADGVSDFNEKLLGLDENDPSVHYADGVIIDVLALFTSAIRAQALGEPETFINERFNHVNQIFLDSGVGIGLRPIPRYISYPDANDEADAVSQLRKGTHAAFEDLPLLRSRYGADLITLFKEKAGDYCGMAYTPTGSFGILDAWRNASFVSVVAEGSHCGATSLAHEIGHNLGLAHSRRQDPEGGAFPFAAGYGVDHRFVTVMAYPEAFGGAKRLGRFSSPDQFCEDFVCGIDPAVDSRNGADAVSVLNAVRFQVANYQDRRPVQPLRAFSGSQSLGQAEGGVTRAGDRTFNGTYAADAALDLELTVLPDPSHAGMQGRLHAAVRLPGQGFLQLGPDKTFIPWDGRVTTLVGASEEITLTERHALTVFEGLAMRDLGIHDADVKVFVAYSLEGDQPDLYYTGTPFQFSVTPR